MVNYNYQFEIGDHVILARHSRSRGDFGIRAQDYGKTATIVWRRQSVTMGVVYQLALDEGSSRRLMDHSHMGLPPYHWNAIEDQLDRVTGPW